MTLSPITKKASDVATFVKRSFGDESAVQVTDADIYRWINSAQQEILTKNKILKAVATTDLVSGTNEYTFPGQNIQEIQAIHVSGRKIEYSSFQEAEEYITSNATTDQLATGSPTLWYEWGGTFYLYPVPETTVVNGIKLYYVKGPTDVTSLNDLLSVPDEYLSRIIEYCLAQAYEMDEDSANSQYKLGQFAQGLDEMADKAISVHADTYPRITILEDDL